MPGRGYPRASDPDVPTALALAAPATLRLTARELRDAAGLDRPTLDALENYGLVRADASGHFDDDALAVARSAAALPAYRVGQAPAPVPHRPRPRDRAGPADRAIRVFSLLLGSVGLANNRL